MNEGRKNDQEKPRLDLISSTAITELARVLTFGAKKYSSHNWRQGIAYSRILAAVLRHVNSYNGGEDKDPETGLSHIAHAMCGCMFLLEYEQNRKEFDDRYKPDTKPVSTLVPREANCDHSYWAPMDEDHLMCTDCRKEINIRKENSCL